MSRSLLGSYQPRCAMEDSDAAFLDTPSSPRRKAPARRIVRGGIALGAASIVGLLAVVAPGIAQSASASSQSTSTEAHSSIRVGTTDAFVARGLSTDRDASRVPAADVATAAAERADSLDAVGEQVVETETLAAAQARTETLSSTGTAIEAEAKRLAEAGTFFWPTEGGISSHWGPRLHPILKYTRLHGGADIGGAVGAPIYAVSDGVVTKAASGGYNGGSGNNVRIDHGDFKGEKLESSYLHMNSIDVAEGQEVRRGQKIGTVGNTGLSTAPHLHFSVYINGVNSDPAPFLNA